jgi:hypothetical protein
MLAQALRGWRNAGHSDFVAFATAGRILNAGSRCIYCLPAEAQAQVRLLGHPLDIGLDHYANPPLAAWLLRPIAALPLGEAAGIFLAVSIAAVVAAAILLGRVLPGQTPGRRALIAICAVTVAPGVGALTYVQWDPLLLLAVAGALVVGRRDDRFAAGALLSVLLLKPQTIWLVVPALLIAGRWRTLTGLCSGAAVWAASTVAIVGTSGVAEWLRSNTQTYVGETWKTAGLPGLVVQVTGRSSLAIPCGAICGLAAVALLWKVRARLRTDAALTVAVGLALSVLATPHVFSADLMLLAPLVVLLAARRPDLAIAATGVLWAAFLVQEPPAGLPVHAIGLAAVAGLLAAALTRFEASAPAVRPAPRTLVGSA